MIEKNIKIFKSVMPLVLVSLLLLTSITAANAVQPSNLINTDTSGDQAMLPRIPPSILNEENTILRDKSLTFLNKVFKLDTAKYTTDVYIPEAVVSNVDKSFNLILSSNESLVSVSCDFRDNEIVWCTLYPVRGQPIYTTEPVVDVLSDAKGVLAELAAFSPKSYLPTIQEMLNSATSLNTASISNTEITQLARITENSIILSWEPYSYGLSYEPNQLGLLYADGRLNLVYNSFGMFTMGFSEVAVSEQEAIRLAIEHVKAFSWAQDGESVSDVTVLEHLINTKLALTCRDDNKLYPYWEVRLGLDKMYLGGVTGFQVMMWADTGELLHITPIGTYAGPGDMADSQLNVPPQQSAPPQTNTYTLVLVFALIALIAAATGYLIYKRKK